MNSQRGVAFAKSVIGRVDRFGMNMDERDLPGLSHIFQLMSSKWDSGGVRLAHSPKNRLEDLGFSYGKNLALQKIRH